MLLESILFALGHVKNIRNVSDIHIAPFSTKNVSLKYKGGSHQGAEDILEDEPEDVSAYNVDKRVLKDAIESADYRVKLEALFGSGFFYGATRSDQRREILLKILRFSVEIGRVRVGLLPDTILNQMLSLVIDSDTKNLEIQLFLAEAMYEDVQTEALYIILHEPGRFLLQANPKRAIPFTGSLFVRAAIGLAPGGITTMKRQSDNAQFSHYRARFMSAAGKPPGERMRARPSFKVPPGHSALQFFLMNATAANKKIYNDFLVSQDRDVRLNIQVEMQHEDEITLVLSKENDGSIKPTIVHGSPSALSLTGTDFRHLLGPQDHFTMIAWLQSDAVLAAITKDVNDFLRGFGLYDAEPILTDCIDLVMTFTYNHGHLGSGFFADSKVNRQLGRGVDAGTLAWAFMVGSKEVIKNKAIEDMLKILERRLKFEPAQQREDVKTRLRDFFNQQTDLDKLDRLILAIYNGPTESAATSQALGAATSQALGAAASQLGGSSRRRGATSAATGLSTSDLHDIMTLIPNFGNFVTGILSNDYYKAICARYKMLKAISLNPALLQSGLKSRMPDPSETLDRYFLGKDPYVSAANTDALERQSSDNVLISLIHKDIAYSLLDRAALYVALLSGELDDKITGNLDQVSPEMKAKMKSILLSISGDVPIIYTSDFLSEIKKLDKVAKQQAQAVYLEEVQVPENYYENTRSLILKALTVPKTVEEQKSQFEMPPRRVNVGLVTNGVPYPEFISGTFTQVTILVNQDHIKRALTKLREHPIQNAKEIQELEERSQLIRTAKLLRTKVIKRKEEKLHELPHRLFLDVKLLKKYINQVEAHLGLAITNYESATSSSSSSSADGDMPAAAHDASSLSAAPSSSDGASSLSAAPSPLSAAHDDDYDDEMPAASPGISLSRSSDGASSSSAAQSSSDGASSADGASDEDASSDEDLPLSYLVRHRPLKRKSRQVDTNNITVPKKKSGPWLGK
jgi:hypothetical protein